MRAIRTKILVLLAVITALLSPLGAAPAYAVTSNNFCNLNDSAGYCLNDWGGGGYGSSVKMYYRNNSNEQFEEVPLLARCNGGHVTATCPFANPNSNALYKGWGIFQIEYNPNLSTSVAQYCVASLSTTVADAQLGNCNKFSTGTGGSNGTVFIDHNGYMINLYWSNYYYVNYHSNNAACMYSVNTAGGLVNLGLETSAGCPQWEQFQS